MLFNIKSELIIGLTKRSFDLTRVIVTNYNLLYKQKNFLYLKIIHNEQKSNLLNYLLPFKVIIFKLCIQ